MIILESTADYRLTRTFSCTYETVTPRHSYLEILLQCPVTQNRLVLETHTFPKDNITYLARIP